LPHVLLQELPLDEEIEQVSEQMDIAARTILEATKLFPSSRDFRRCGWV